MMDTRTVRAPRSQRYGTMVRKTPKTLYSIAPLAQNAEMRGPVQKSCSAKGSGLLLVLVGCEAESLRKFQRKISAHVDSHCRSYVCIN